MLKLQDQRLPVSNLDCYSINIDLVEEFGPAGGNPNINIHFGNKWDAIQFLMNYVGLEEADDLESYFI